MKKIVAASLALLFVVSGYFVKDAISDTRLGVLIHTLTAVALPMQSTDNILMERGSLSFRTPGTTVLQSANNLSDVTNRASSRTNVGLGPSVSIMDYPTADPTGATSSDPAFVSCTTSGKNCYIPPGTYQIACTTHNTNNGTIIYGDDIRASTLKLPAGCAFPTTGLINLANIQTLSIDLNTPVVPGSAVSVVTNFITGGAVNLTPSYQNMQILNGVTNMYLLNVGAQATGNVIAIVKDNIFRLGSPDSTHGNQCVLFTNGVTNSVIGGKVSGNVCVNAGMTISGSDVIVENNDISNYAFSAGIVLAQTSVTFNNHVLGNRIYNAGTAIDVNGSPTNGIVNWGKNSEISNNIIRNVGGACIDNGGQNSTFIGNYCLDAENRIDTFGDAAYFVFYQDTTYNGNGSSWIGNYATDDRGTGAKIRVGYQDSTNNANIFLSGNVFSGIAKPYFLQ